MNELLASYQVFKMNVKAYHWFVKGNFFVMHEKFEDLYQFLDKASDDIAEAIITKDKPAHTYADYIALSKIKTDFDLKEDFIQKTIDGFRVLLDLKRNLLKTECDYRCFLLEDLIREEEKLVWMLSSCKNS